MMIEDIDSIKDKFWAKVDIRGTDECWPWIGRVKQGTHPYGYFSVKSKSVRANRVALTLSKGFKPALNALHTCDNPRCCNPGHLYWGTMLENVRDCSERNRHNPEKGEDRYNAKLTVDAVRYIRQTYKGKNGEITIKKLAEMFKCHEASVAAVIHKRRWKHVV